LPLYIATFLNHEEDIRGAACGCPLSFIDDSMIGEGDVQERIGAL
jgi:hypothetical protein